MSIVLECRRTGGHRELPVQRWHEPATSDELALLERVSPPVLDVGCGPGRIAAALAERGIPSLGIDVAPEAIRHATSLGAAVLHRSVFAPVPGEGRWSTVLLLDGNVGIGGDPAGLLARCAQLAVEGGHLLVEVDPAEVPTSLTEVRILSEGSEPGPWFPWATVSVRDIGALAADAGASLEGVVEHGGRLHAELRVLARSGARPAPRATAGTQPSRVPR